MPSDSQFNPWPSGPLLYNLIESYQTEQRIHSWTHLFVNSNTWLDLFSVAFMESWGDLEEAD